MKISNTFPVLKHFNVPNVITTLGLVFGIFAAFFLTQRDLRMAIIFLFIAGCMDMFDGLVATKLNQQSDFGKHLDTLVDFFTCVIMPVWMVFDLLDNHPALFAGLVFYCICGLWRLANYSLTGGGKHFTGMPVPSAMSIVTITIWCLVTFGITFWVAVIVFAVAGLLMISAVPLAKYGRWQKIAIVLGVAFLVIVVLDIF